MPSILFIAAHRSDRSPSQRFRFEQYFKYLKEQGWDYVFSYLISIKDDDVLYSHGNFIKKGWLLLLSICKRLKDVYRSKDFDIVFVQREAIMIGSSFFERQFARKSLLIFDFDDAIWLTDKSKNNSIFQRLKNPKKTAKIISYCDLTIAGNNYLAEYAKKYTNKVQIIPTTIDTNIYVKKTTKNPSDLICIGWSGSFSTIKHFETVIKSLLEIKYRYKEKVSFKVIGDGTYYHQGLGIKGIAWDKANEINELSEIDIGIMPLPDDEWSKGKCGLKGLQYMALEIPTIMSPIGMNEEIIEHGKNGLLARTPEDWVKCISLLIDNPEKRKLMGYKGRETVNSRYSVKANQHKYLEVFNMVNTNTSK